MQASCFFDGKRLVGEDGEETRVRLTQPGNPLRILVEDASAFETGETFRYLDLGPGDTVCIAYSRATP